MQEIVLVVSLLAILGVAALFLAVLRETAPGEPGWSRPESQGRLRARLVVGAVVLGLVLTVATLVPWPHAVPAGQGVVPVNIRARM